MSLWSSTKKVLTIVTLAIAMVTLLLVGYLKVTGGMLVSIQTGSMVPHLRRGDMTVVRKVAPSNIKKGNVVTFVNPTNPSQTITHRIIATSDTLGGNMFQTKGDANNLPDTPVPASRILGRVDYSVPKFGYATDFIRKPLGLGLVIYVPAVIVIGVEMQRLTQYYRKQQPYVVRGRRKRRV